jgi:hypothetical protein
VLAALPWSTVHSNCKEATQQAGEEGVGTHKPSIYVHRLLMMIGTWWDPYQVALIKGVTL